MKLRKKLTKESFSPARYAFIFVASKNKRCGSQSSLQRDRFYNQMGIFYDACRTAVVLNLYKSVAHF